MHTREDILRGQDVWRSIGGQELGSIWGHGAYTAPDWTAPRGSLDPRRVVSRRARRALAAVARHYVDLFTDATALDGLRESYAMPRGTVSTEAHARDMTAFFFWATWACVTERPGSEMSYTHNWPPEQLVGNTPSGELVVISVASMVLLLGGIGAVSWFFAARRREEDPEPLAEDPLARLTVTPSMHADRHADGHRNHRGALRR